MLTATGIRAGELAGIRYDPLDPRCSDLDLWAREITVRGKGGNARVVRIGHEAARALDRYLRVRSRHGQAWRRELWLGINNRGPIVTANKRVGAGLMRISFVSLATLSRPGYRPMDDKPERRGQPGPGRASIFTHRRF